MYLPGAQTSLGGDTFTLAQESVLGDPADQEAEGSHSPALGSEGRDSGAAVLHPRNGGKGTWTQTVTLHVL